MKEIYTQFHGKMTKVNEPSLPQNANFVITWRGKDWSGFRTLEECEKQFPELEARKNATDDLFAVVEK